MPAVAAILLAEYRHIGRHEFKNASRELPRGDKVDTKAAGG
jgi:hypothetical protein